MIQRRLRNSAYRNATTQSDDLIDSWQLGTNGSIRPSASSTPDAGDTSNLPRSKIECSLTRVPNKGEDLC
jgi:hypothetical protein